MSELPFRAPASFEALCSNEKREGGHWFVFCGDKLLVEMGPLEQPSDDPRVRARPAWARLPLQKNHNWLGSEPAHTLYLGRLGGVDCWAAELGPDATAPAGMAWEGLRPLFSVLDDDHFALAGRALQLLEWDRTSRFCGRCGTPTEPKREERVRVCPACKLSAYPRVAPAVMALVRKEREILLAAARTFRRACTARSPASSSRASRSSSASRARSPRKSACASGARATSRASRGRSRIR